jgi:hypothetical protein
MLIGSLSLIVIMKVLNPILDVVMKQKEIAT